MKVRILSSVAGLALLAVVFIFMNTVFFNIAFAIVGVIAVYELLRASGCAKNPILLTLSLIVAAVIPFAHELGLISILPQVIYIVVSAFFLVLLKSHGALSVEQVVMAFFFSIFIPMFFSSAILLRDSFGPETGGLYLLWALCSAWLSDTGAYFTGRAFGKHKLAPVISPAKTVEGAVGGVLFSSALTLLVALAYQVVIARLSGPINVNYPLMLALTPFFSVAGILGDLTASLIKRQFGVKDYGSIMPGHGGVLDRFDSVLFTIPAVYVVSQHIAVITAI